MICFFDIFEYLANFFRTIWLNGDKQTDDKLSMYWNDSIPCEEVPD